MNNDLKNLLDFDEKPYCVIGHLMSGKFSPADSEKTAEVFNIATDICNKDENYGIAQGIECFYYIFQMWRHRVHPYSSSNDKQRAGKAIGNARIDIDELIDSSLENTPTKEIDYSIVGNLNLEASRLAQGTIGSRGLMWELNDHIFSAEDVKKMNRLTEITKQLIEYNPEVAKALQVLNSVVEWGPNTENDRSVFEADFDRAFEWVNKINQYLVKLY